MAIFRGTGGSGDSTTDTTVNTVTQKAAEAAASATAAASSATQAANSAASINANIVNDTTPQLGGELDGQTNKITNIGDPTSAQDAATKTYVDSQVQAKDALSELSGDSDDITEGSTNLFLTTTERTKLSGIEASATADQTAEEIRTLVESASDSNVFTDADHSKLNAIEANATADQTDAEIKTAYENNSDTNAFTDAEKTKLSGIETGATADQTASEILTAIKTVDGSGSGLDADLLDGNEASAFATSAQGSTADSALQNVSEDTTPQLGGNLDTNSKAILFGDGATFGSQNHLFFGTDGGLDIYHYNTGSIEGSIIGNTQGTLTISQAVDDQDIDVFCDNGSGGVTQYLKADGSEGELILYHYGSQKLATKSSGVDITGNITVSGTVDGRDLATDGTKLDGVASSATANPNAIDNLVEDTTPQLGGVLDTNGNNIEFGDSTGAEVERLKFGADDDLQIYHNGTNSVISEEGTGNLKIRASTLQIMNAAGGKNEIVARQNAEVELYHNGSEKLATTSSGVDITGILQTSSDAIIGGDLTVSGTTTTVNTETINLADNNIVLNSNHTGTPTQSAGITIERGSSTDKVFQWNETNDYWETDDNFNVTGNITVSGTVDGRDVAADGATADAALPKAGGTMTGDLVLGDNVKAKFGASNDLEIFHDGSNSRVRDVGTGDLLLQGNNLKLTNQNYSQTYLQAFDGGEVQLRHNNVQKFATKATGIDVTGTVTADGFLGGTNVLRINSLEGSRGSIQISAPHLGTREVTYGNNFYLASDGTYTQDSAVIGGGLLQITAPNAEFGEFLFKSKQDPDSGGAVRDRLKIANTGDISFYNDAGSSEELYWDASESRLGIGTTSPNRDLHVLTSSGVSSQFEGTNNHLIDLRSGTDASYNGIRFYEDTSHRMSISYIPAGDYIQIGTGWATGSEKLVVTQSGNVGIGTTDPAQLLHLKGADVGLILDDTDGTSTHQQTWLKSDNGNFRLQTRNSSNTFVSNDYLVQKGASGATSHQWRIGNSEAARIDSNGRLGIGTTSPAQTLHVDGRVLVESIPGTQTNLELRPNSTLTGYHPNMVLRSQQNGSAIYGLTNGQNFAWGLYDNGVPSDPSGFIRFVPSNANGNYTPKVYIGDSGSTNPELNIGSVEIVGNGSVLDVAGGITTTGNVGIGTSNPSAQLELSSSTGSTLRLSRNDTTVVGPNSIGTIEFYTADSDSAGVGASITGLADGSGGNVALAFSSGTGGSASEAMRIDSSGNLLVGTTSDLPGFGNTTTGHSLQNGGFVLHSRSGGTVAYMNRNSSDGTIVDLRKDGTTIGSIGCDSGLLTIGESGQNQLAVDYDTATGINGVRLQNSGASGGGIIIANNGTTIGPYTDDSIILGNNSQRFKNLYLSGGVYLGGTGSANLLDDYEEGTWTPTATVNGFSQTISSLSGNYTKIGRSVTVNLQITLSAAGYASSYSQIGTLPFTPNGNSAGVYSSGQLAANGRGNNTTVLFNNTSFWLHEATGTQTSTIWYATITYFTNS